MNKHGDLPEDNLITYRSGVAARMAGLSPETLRVWERRYNVSGAERSARGQRLYSPMQVRKLRVLKQLVDQGHAIGVLAAMSAAQIEELLGASVQAPPSQGPISVGVIGNTLARRIAASFLSADVVVQFSRPHLDSPAPTIREPKIDVLVIEQSELHESAVPQIVAARQACDTAAVIVLYRFCASATIRALRSQGCVVLRTPADISELLAMCRAALRGEPLPVESTQSVPSLKFDENALLTIMGAGSGLACECPRHLADLLLMVGSFERYSAQCASRNDDDARLHKSLQHAAGQARAILEVAMDKLVRAEGLPYEPRGSR